MSQKRMFSKKITDSPEFLKMPLSTQCLYFHLNMHADDDGVIDNMKQTARLIGANEDDMKLLLAKSFLLIVESDIFVVRDWWVHNTLLQDRYVESPYHELLYTRYSKGKDKKFTINDNKMLTKCCPKASLTVENRVEENSIDKSNINKSSVVESTDKPDPVYQKLESIFADAPMTWVYAIDQYKGVLADELIIHAIDETAIAGVTNPKYFKAICERYKINGYKTLKDLEKQSKTKQTKKSKEISREEYNKGFIEQVKNKMSRG